MQLPRHPQRLEVRDRPARGQVPEVRLGEPEHRRQLGDRLLLHLARHRPAVERVVVRVDQHRGDVAGGRDRVRRLEHLARRSAGGRTGSCRPSGARTPPTRRPSASGSTAGGAGRSPQRDSHASTRSSAASMPDRSHARDHAWRRLRARALRRSSSPPSWPGCGRGAASVARERPRRCHRRRRQSAALVWGLERRRCARRGGCGATRGGGRDACSGAGSCCCGPARRRWPGRGARALRLRDAAGRDRGRSAPLRADGSAEARAARSRVCGAGRS